MRPTISCKKFVWALVLVLLALPTLIAVAQFLIVPPVTATSSGQYGDPYKAWGYNSNEPRHTGKDFAAGCGSSVVAPSNGVIYATFNDWKGYGQNVWIKIDENLYSFHAHLSQTSVQVDQQVAQGEQIGLSGNTGIITGCTHHWGLSNQPPEQFGSFYEHADEQSDGRGWLDPDQLGNLLSGQYQPVVQAQPEEIAYQGFASLPFIIDQRSQVAEIMPIMNNCHDINIDQIVIHQIAVASLSDPGSMDGTRLSSAFKSVKGWDRPGYQLLVGWNETEYGYTEVFQMSNLDCRVYGVRGETNARSVQISYVDYPPGGPASPMQYETLLVLTKAIMEEYGLNANQVRGHKEICCHSDPNFSMDQFRQDLSGGNIPQNFQGQGNNFVSVVEALPFSLVTYQQPQEEPFVVEMIDKQGNLQEATIDLRSGEIWLNAPQALEQATKPVNQMGQWRNWALAAAFGLSVLLASLFNKHSIRIFGLLGLLICALILLFIVISSANGYSSTGNNSELVKPSSPTVVQNTPKPIAMIWPEEAEEETQPPPPDVVPSGELAPYFYRVPVGIVWGEKIQQWTQPYPNIDPNMAATIMTIESCGNEDARSGTGACGLFQLWGRSGEACTNPEANAQQAMVQFNGNLQSASGNWTAAMAGYNGGPMALKWQLGEISRADYISFLQNHDSGNWIGDVAVSKANQVERYVHWAGMYTNQEVFNEFIAKATGMCSGAAAKYNLAWPINP
jgi:hypothetical protein